MSGWLEILRGQVDSHGKGGLNLVAQELGLAKSGLSMALNGKYPASTAKLEARVLEVYGGRKLICPVLGEIEIKACRANQARAKVIGLRAGNPETLRLLKSCLSAECSTKS